MLSERVLPKPKNGTHSAPTYPASPMTKTSTCGLRLRSGIAPLRAPQTRFGENCVSEYHKTITSPSTRSGEAKVDNAFKALRQHFGDNTTSAVVFQQIMQFNTEAGESTSRSISRFQALIQAYTRKCKSEGTTPMSEDCTLFKEAFLEGIGLIDHMKSPDTLEELFIEARDLIRRRSKGQSRRDRASAAALQRRPAAKGVNAVTEDAMEILMTKLDEKFREHKRDSVKAIADCRGVNFSDARYPNTGTGAPETPSNSEVLLKCF